MTVLLAAGVVAPIAKPNKDLPSMKYQSESPIARNKSAIIPVIKPDLRSIGDRPRSACGERVISAIKEAANPLKIVKPISKFEKPSSCLNSAPRVMTLDNPADIPKSIKK